MTETGPKALGDLPTELLQLVISILDQDSSPPLAHLLREQPSQAFFRSSHSGSLKQLSTTCRSVRSLVVPSLFAHLKVDLGDLACLQALFGLMEALKCQGHARSLLVYLEKKSSPSNNARLWTFRDAISRLMDTMNAKVLTVVAPSHEIGWLADHQNNLDDEWAFKIEYQVLRLEQGAACPNDWFPRHAVHDSGGVFTLRPWTHWTYNEGSFVPAYSTYEYHLYQAPSLHQPALFRELQCQALQLGCLRSFELIAVFPFDHINTTCQYFLERLPSLELLTIQLAPSPISQKDNLDSSASSSSACQPGDFWRELEEDYVLLRNCVSYNLPRLSRYAILDCMSPGYRGIIDPIMEEISADWKTVGNGVWRRKRIGQALNLTPSRIVGDKCPQL